MVWVRGKKPKPIQQLKIQLEEQQAIFHRSQYNPLSTRRQVRPKWSTLLCKERRFLTLLSYQKGPKLISVRKTKTLESRKESRSSGFVTYAISSPAAGTKPNQHHPKKANLKFTPTRSSFCLWKNLRIITMPACFWLVKDWSKNSKKSS